MADWAHLAACRGVNPDVFFPKGGRSRVDRAEDTRIYYEARSYCDRCEVRAACLAECLKREASPYNSGRWGMWGGLTPHDRYDLARRGRIVRRVVA